MKCNHVRAHTPFCPVCGAKLMGNGAQGEIEAYILAQIETAKSNLKKSQDEAAFDVSKCQVDHRSWAVDRKERAQENIPKREAIVKKWERWYDWIRSIKVSEGGATSAKAEGS